MALHKIFPTLVQHETLLKGPAGLSLLNELVKESAQIADHDKDGQRWSQNNYTGGYTSYGSLSRLFEMSSTFAKLKKLIDSRVMTFARDCSMDLKPGELQMVSLWVNILRAGGQHSLHLHPLSTISGTVYLATPKSGGLFKVEDPRLSKMMAAPRRRGKPNDIPGGFFKISPKKGDVVLFESWLRHEVEAHFDSSDRISVSFNYNWF